MPVLGRGSNRVCITKSPAEKAARAGNSQSLGRAAQKAHDGAAVIAAEIHRTIEFFRTQRAQHRPTVLYSRPAAEPGQNPYFGQSGMVLEQGGSGLRGEHVQLGFGVMLAEGLQRGNQHDGVAQRFKLDCQNFPWRLHPIEREPAARLPKWGTSVLKINCWIGLTRWDLSNGDSLGLPVHSATRASMKEKYFCRSRIGGIAAYCRVHRFAKVRDYRNIACGAIFRFQIKAMTRLGEWARR